MTPHQPADLPSPLQRAPAPSPAPRDSQPPTSPLSAAASDMLPDGTTTGAPTTTTRPVLTSVPGLVHSEMYCRAHADHYAAGLDSTPTCALRLLSGAQEHYILTKPSVEREHAPVLDVLAAMRMMSTEKPNLFEGETFQEALDRGFRRNDHKKGREDTAYVVEIVQRFNDALDTAIKQGAKLRSAAPLSSNWVAHIWRQSYERIVDNPDSLNRYQSFSREVYGETCVPLVSDILRQIPLAKQSLFVDLGMGIGNVVFQVAAQAQCNVYGIELLDKPFEYAELLAKELTARTFAYGRKLGAMVLRKGDFLQSPELVVLMPDVDVVFCQNYAFDAQTNNGLINLFLTMKNGAKIVSFKPFAPIRTRLTEHSINDPTSIFRVTKHTYSRPDGVSWMTTPIDYFIHTVDRDQYKRASEDILRASSVSPRPERSPKRAKRPTSSDGDDST